MSAWSNWKDTGRVLPYHNEQILFVDKNGYKCFGYYDKENKYFHEFHGDDYFEGDVQGWLRIPEFDL